MPRSLRMALEPVEHLVLDLGGNARSGVGYREYHAALGTPRADGNGRTMRRETDRVGEQIIEYLHHPALVAGEIADAGVDLDLERDAIGREAVLNAFGG